MEKAHTTLEEIIDGTRDNSLCDVYFNTPDGTDEEDKDMADNEAVSKAVISVKAAIDAMAEKMNTEDRARRGETASALAALKE